MNITKRILILAFFGFVTGCAQGTAPAHSSAVAQTTKNFEVHFDLGSDEIRSQDFAVLDEAARLIRSQSQNVWLVEGHTDEVGDTSFNLELGDRRAKVVKAYLLGKGISPQRLVTVTFGDGRPKVSGAHSELANRRVILRVGR